MKSLSDADIKNFFNKKINLVSYPDIKNYKTIDNLLGLYGKCIILYLTSSHYGHWTCIFKYNNEIHFFDSYGIQPDMELKFIDNNERIQLKQKIPYLSNLIIKSGYQVNYNQYKFQKEDMRITSCGSWCCLRLTFYDLSDDEFNKFIKKLKINDKVVSDLIEGLIY